MKGVFFISQGCATSPNDSERQQTLRSAAEELRSATNTAASNALKKKLIKRLEVRNIIMLLGKLRRAYAITLDPVIQSIA